MKLGLSIKIDVSKIEKARLYKGEKGTYLDLTTFVDLDNPGQYGDHGFISQSVSKEERGQGVQTPILGNVKVFYRDDSAAGQSGQQQSNEPQGGGDFSDEIPFAPLRGTNAY